MISSRNIDFLRKYFIVTNNYALIIFLEDKLYSSLPATLKVQIKVPKSLKKKVYHQQPPPLRWNLLYLILKMSFRECVEKQKKEKKEIIFHIFLINLFLSSRIDDKSP